MKLQFKPNDVPYRLPRPNNMGVVRYAMAFYVVWVHFSALTGIDMPATQYVVDVVNGFFALSGFLVMGPYLREPRLKPFFVGRCWRLLPAYWTSVLLFAVVLFFFSTSADYFASAQFWKYLAANMMFLNFLEPDLPGVFLSNPAMSAVNGALWTMKVEWMLYLSVPLVAWALGRCKRRPAVVLILIYVVSGLYRAFLLSLHAKTGSELYRILSYQFVGQFMYFYSGMLVYYYFDLFVRLRRWVFPVCLVLLLCFIDHPVFGLTLKPLVITLLVLWLSMTGRWGAWEGAHENLSYGIYLVHFPLIQIVVLLGLPQRMGVWPALLLVALAAVAVAWVVNAFVERPLRRRFFRKS